jgi:hypothetical protein
VAPERVHERLGDVADLALGRAQRRRRRRLGLLAAAREGERDEAG